MGCRGPGHAENQCVEILCDLERFGGTGKQQPDTRLRPLESEQTEVQKQGQVEGPTGQSPAMTVSEQQVIVQGMAQITQDMRWLMEQVQRQAQMLGQSQQGPGPGPQQQNFQGGGRGHGRGRRPYVERPSAEQPCRICKATDHWERRCPQRNQQAGAGANRGPAAQQNNQYQGNAGGLDPRSGAQSDQRK